MKKLLLVLSAFQLFSLSAFSQDLQQSTSFVDGQRITASQLNSLVSSASLLPAAISTKPAATALNGADLIMLYSGSVLYKITGNALLYQNTTLFTGAVAGNPAQNDLLLMCSVTGTNLFKVPLSTIIASNLFSAFGTSTDAVFTLPQKTNWVLTVQNGTYDGTNNAGGSNILRSVSSVFQEGMYFSTPTNLAANTALTPLDAFLVWTTANGTNYNARRSSYIGLITNLVAVTNVAGAANTNISASTPTVASNSAFVLVNPWQTNGVSTSSNGVQQVTLATLQAWLTNYFMLASQAPFVSPLIGLPAAAGIVTNMSHGLSSTPSQVKWVLHCSTADNGFVVGDEIAVGQIEQEPSVVAAMGANTTNIFMSIASGGISLADKNTGNRVSITRSSWKAKCYATP